jgi:hypothetical protein
MKKKLEQIAREDGRFSPQALRFVHEGLGHTVKKVVPGCKKVGQIGNAGIK